MGPSSAQLKGNPAAASAQAGLTGGHTCGLGVSWRYVSFWGKAHLLAALFPLVAGRHWPLISSGFTSLTWSQYQKGCRWNNINNVNNNYLLRHYSTVRSTLHVLNHSKQEPPCVSTAQVRTLRHGAVRVKPRFTQPPTASLVLPEPCLTAEALSQAFPGAVFSLPKQPSVTGSIVIQGRQDREVK